jgi:hypothetical protein
MTKAGARAASDIVRDGFVVLGEVFDPRDVESLRAGVEVLLTARSGGCCSRPNNTLVPLR